MLLRSELLQNWKKYRMLILLMSITAILLFANTNNLPLWHDEASTVALSSNILKYGYPRVLDGNKLTVHNPNEIGLGYAFSNNTWLHYYICAGSIALLGQSNLAVRLPFILCGLATVFIIWKISFFLYKKIDLANLTASLTTIYVPFLLYAKQARYYSVNMLLITISIYVYLILFEDWPTNQRKKVVWFFVSAVLLLLNDILAFAVLFLSIFLHLAYIKKIFKLKILISVIGAIILVLMSYLVFGNFISISNNISARFLVIFWKLNVYFIPMLSLLIVLAIISIIHFFFKKEQLDLFSSNDFLFPLLILSNIIVVMISEYNIMNHFFLGVVIATPFVLTAVFQYSMQISKTMAALIIMLVVSSNILNVAPYYVLDIRGFEPKNQLQTMTKFGQPHLTPYNQYDYLYYTSRNTIYSELSGPILRGLIASPFTMADCLILPLYKYYEKLKIESYLYNYYQEITGDYINAPMEIIKLLQEYGKTAETVFISTIEYEYVMLYTDMRVVNRFIFEKDSELARLTNVPDEEIDWFIVTSDKYIDQLEDPEYLINNRHLFTQYAISTNDYLNTPDLDLHVFETTYDGDPIIILHRIN